TFLILADLGSSEQLLNNTEHMRDSAQALMKRGIVPAESGWAGWLGKYEARLVRSFEAIRSGRQYGTETRDEPSLGR
ncbi:MAG: hypothetical protein DMG15_07300, partial [Acidobacteria bacterium]